jgi:cytoskeletal protein CcmA (bactofilin family)
MNLLLALLLVCATLSTGAFADEDRSRTQVGHNINIEAGEEVSELTCFGCNIRVRGHVDGDVTTFGGSITLEDQGQIAGDTTAFAGDLNLNGGVKIGGDVAVFGGRIRRDSEATVGGDVTNLGGRGWIFLIFGTPFIFLGLLVGLVYWIVQRLRRPSLPATAG